MERLQTVLARLLKIYSLQCFDTVHWVTGRVSGQVQTVGSSRVPMSVEDARDNCDTYGH